MKIKDITHYLEQTAPLSYQESYDNCGLLTGNAEHEVSGVITTLDCTEEVVDEAIVKGCNLIVAHHPIIFSGLKKITGKNYIERTIIKAIKNDIAIYAIHTNLDNIHTGVNQKIAHKIGLENLRILAPKKGFLEKLVVFVPAEHTKRVMAALFEAGAGRIGDYDECSFSATGLGSFRGNEYTHPFVGEQGKRHMEKESRLEVVVPTNARKQVIHALLSAHPYEEVAYDIYPLVNHHPRVGSGIVGELAQEEDSLEFLKKLKSIFNASCIRHTSLHQQRVKRIAVCGGSGSFLLNDAIQSGADVFITADYKYHQFFDAENRIIIADIGHYESEQFTAELLSNMLKEKFTSLNILLSETKTNPVNYL